MLIQNELNKLLRKAELMSTKGLTKDLINKYSIVNGAKYFSSVGLQNYLIFTPPSRYITAFIRANKIYSWISKGISDESIKSPSESGSTFVPEFIVVYPSPKIKFNRKWLTRYCVSPS